jgi:integrase
MIGRYDMQVSLRHVARQPKFQQKETSFWGEYEAMQFLMAAKGHRHEALFNLGIKTGMRQGELMGLKWSDINWHKTNLRVERQAQREKGK